MNAKQFLPKRVVTYIHDTGIRALDHVAEHYESSGAPDAVQTLVGQWKALSASEKEHFVDRVAASTVEVVAASAALPLGLKLGKKAARAAKRVIRKRTKKIRKSAAVRKAKKMATSS